MGPRSLLADTSNETPQQRKRRSEKNRSQDVSICARELGENHPSIHRVACKLNQQMPIERTSGIETGGHAGTRRLPSVLSQEKVSRLINAAGNLAVPALLHDRQRGTEES